MEKIQISQSLAGRRSWGTIVLSRERMERFQKSGTRPAQGLGVVPGERLIFHGKERNGMERNDFKKEGTRPVLYSFVLDQTKVSRVAL